MGARLPPTDRPRRGGIKCEFCGRFVPSVQALRSHQNSLHSKALKDKEKARLGVNRLVKAVKPKPTAKVNAQKPAKPESQVRAEKSKSEEVKAKIVKKKSSTEKDKPSVAKVKPKAAVETAVTASTVAEEKTMAPKTGTGKSTEFKCPRCEKQFSMLFSAQRHIQKHHSDEKDEEAIKPIQLDFCLYCDSSFVSPHVCPNRPQPGFGLWYECTGCQQRFQTNKFFDIHVSDVHGDNSESMFFPKAAEFNTWKEQMESQTKCTFTIMGQYNGKQIYRCCNLPSDTKEDVAQFCPATIVCSLFPNGSQVNFYPTHYGHDHNAYGLSEQYKSYSITDLIQQAGGESREMSDDNDLYLQFKTLMDSIVFDAAKINIDTLKILVGKALEMTSVLTQYDEDEDVLTTVNTSTLICTPPQKKEDGITQALAGLRSRKRGLESNGLDAKKRRNTFSLADKKDSDKILRELLVDSKGIKSEDTENIKLNFEKKLNQSPSFADSYKQFVDTTIAQKVNAPIVKKKTFVKTKMGQFKPSLSPKKQLSLGKAKEIEYEVKERSNDCNILILKI